MMRCCISHVLVFSRITKSYLPSTTAFSSSESKSEKNMGLKLSLVVVQERMGNFKSRVKSVQVIL